MNQKMTESVRKENQMNYAKSNIPLMRLGDVRRTLKRTFKIKPGRVVKLKSRTRDDDGRCKAGYYKVKVAKLYPYVVQLELGNGQYMSPSYSKLYLMLHGAEEEQE